MQFDTECIDLLSAIYNKLDELVLLAKKDDCNGEHSKPTIIRP